MAAAIVTAPPTDPLVRTVTHAEFGNRVDHAPEISIHLGSMEAERSYDAGNRETASGGLRDHPHPVSHPATDTKQGRFQHVATARVTMPLDLHDLGAGNVFAFHRDQPLADVAQGNIPGDPSSESTAQFAASTGAVARRLCVMVRHQGAPSITSHQLDERVLNHILDLEVADDPTSHPGEKRNPCSKDLSARRLVARGSRLATSLVLPAPRRGRTRILEMRKTLGSPGM